MNVQSPPQKGDRILLSASLCHKHSKIAKARCYRWMIRTARFFDNLQLKAHHFFGASKLAALLIELPKIVDHRCCEMMVLAMYPLR